MIDISELRRLVQAASPGPDGVSLSWITFLQDFQQSANPAAISELLDRLEEAESAALEQARLNGMGSEREAALLAKLEAAEKERDWNAERLEDAIEECAALRAKIEAMEKQEPMELNYIELLNSAQKSVESYVYFRRFIASTPLENDIAIWMVDFVFAQLNAKGE